MGPKEREPENRVGQVIASTYRIREQIGAGGAGVVYLGEHLRLGKLVVLKADRRTITTKQQTLRREVDALKNLSHTYIPQVYDFVVENGIVYTVMDYIEGESLDKPLKRGIRFPQAQVVQWACQLLEALIYLHTRPPHGILHGDIKPANVMLRTNGDICLIDFNIALALGEEGAVRVGYSHGYASPEHYGMRYSQEGMVTTPLQSAGSDSEMPGSSGNVVSTRRIVLDARSDIYSLGATLYHLFSGQRPPQNAQELCSLTGAGLSPQIMHILTKAMAPDIRQRYQSAQEMLADFRSLHEKDIRAQRHRRHKKEAALLIAGFFLVGGCSAFLGLKGMERHQNLLTLAEYAQNALDAGNKVEAITYALEALPQPDALNPGYVPLAQNVLSEALGVYDLSDGFKPGVQIELPSEPLKVICSPEGTKVCLFYGYEAAVYETVGRAQVAMLPTQKSALCDMFFLDESHLLYAGMEGVTLYDLDTGQSVWKGGQATQLTLSGDGKRVAAIDRDETAATIYDTFTGHVVAQVDFEGRHQRILTNDLLADPNDDLFALNHDGTVLATSFSDGTLRTYDLEQPDESLIILEESQYTHFEGGFYGDILGFSANVEGDALFALIDVPNSVQIGASASTNPFYTRIGADGIYLAHEDVLVRIDEQTGAQTEVAFTEGMFITDFVHAGSYTVVVTEDNNWWIFGGEANCIAREAAEYTVDCLGVSEHHIVLGSLNSPTVNVLEMITHPETTIFSYDPAISHMEARVSEDWSTLMLFDYKGFTIYNMQGTLMIQVELPDTEEIYDQQYRRTEDNSYLEITYNNGSVRTYDAKDGTLIGETKGEVPDSTLYEEFYTDRLKITAPLHEAPIAYDRESGAEIRVLEEDALLTYVTQVEDYVITEYLSTDGMRFGLVLDENCETVAYLPYLCDVMDGYLFFDYPTGSVRQSHLYSVQELIELANEQEG